MGYLAYHHLKAQANSSAAQGSHKEPSCPQLKPWDTTSAPNQGNSPHLPLHRGGGSIQLQVPDFFDQAPVGVWRRRFAPLNKLMEELRATTGAELDPVQQVGVGGVFIQWWRSPGRGGPSASGHTTQSRHDGRILL